MSTIEFRCPQCDKLLRVGAAYAGKDARCPQCGTVSAIPAGPTKTSPVDEEHPLGPLPSRPAAAPPAQRPMPAPLGATPASPGPMPATQPAATDPPRAPAGRLSMLSTTDSGGSSPTRELFQ